MSYDWHAAFRVGGEEAADQLVRGHGAFREVADIYARIRLLSQVQALPSEAAGDWARSRRHYRTLVQPGGDATRSIDSRCKLMEHLGILWPRLDAEAMRQLPTGSFAFQFAFRLAEPFTSRDDVPFYPHDNPLRREWVFKVPMLAASGWKGLLRDALRRIVGEADPDMELLFGPERPDEPGHDVLARAGRLLFYPAFFDRMGIEMFSPHNRRTGAGRDPFHVECVPQGGMAVFSLLCVPFDCAGLPFARYRGQTARHIRLVGAAVRVLFCTLGFSAKRSSGFGMAEESITGPGGHGHGSLCLRIERRTTEAAPGTADVGEPAVRPLPPEAVDFLEDGLFPLLSKDELAQRGWGEEKISRYKRARYLYLEWRQSQEGSAVAAAPPQPPPVIERKFSSLAELVAVAEGLASSLEVADD